MLSMPWDSRPYFRRRYHERRAEWIAKLGGVCIDCGSSENLQFDHADASTKSFDVSRAMTHTTKIEAELAKCVLRCRACHRRKTVASGEHGGGHNKLPDEAYLHGTARMYHKGCRCELCREAKRQYRRGLTTASEVVSAPMDELGRRRPYEREVPHGDRRRYVRGCRCGECRAANAAYTRMRVSSRGKDASPPS
jgi:hypothetical protein